VHGSLPGEVPGRLRGWKEFVQPDDYATVLKKVRQALETGSFEADWRVLWPDHTLHWLSARGKVLKNDAGEPLRMVGVHIDVTERKLAEEALRDSELRYSSLAEALPAIIFTTSAEGETDYVNRRWQEYTGQTLEESCARGFASLLYPADRETVQHLWSRR
jgi:PAS domain-containing protein